MSYPQTAPQKPHSTLPVKPTVLQMAGGFLRRQGIALILLSAIFYLWFRPPATVTVVNQAAAPWSVQLIDGRTLTSAQLKGQVVLVNFWASWCPYCLKEMPVIEEFWQDHRARGFEVIAVSVDDPPEKVAQWMREHGYRFNAAVINPSIRAAFGDTSSLPTSFIVDRHGNIQHKIKGQVHYPRLEKLVLPLLNPASIKEKP